MIGGLTGGLLATTFGPKKSLLYVQSLSIIGAISMGICKESSSYELLLIGRFLSGLSCGTFTALVPLYITEVQPYLLKLRHLNIDQISNFLGSTCPSSWGTWDSQPTGSHLWDLCEHDIRPWRDFWQ